MTARIEPGDQVKIARAAGKAGKAQPEWSKADPELDAAYRDGAGLPPAEPPQASPPAGDDASKPPVKHPQSNPARSAGGTRSPGPAAQPAKPSRAARAGKRVKQGDAGARQASRSFLSGGGDGAGLMLAVFFYPLGLAILQHGPAGLGIWLKAKFLNQVTAKPGSKPATPSAPPTQNTNPSGPNYVPPRPPGWKGQWPPPGTNTPPAPGTATV